MQFVSKFVQEKWAAINFFLSAIHTFYLGFLAFFLRLFFLSPACKQLF